MQSIPMAIAIGLILGFACFGVVKTAESIKLRVFGLHAITCQQVLQ